MLLANEEGGNGQTTRTGFYAIGAAATTPGEANAADVTA
jgi:hypothetical protein